jgi:hypothetical protein
MFAAHEGISIRPEISSQTVLIMEFPSMFVDFTLQTWFLITANFYFRVREVPLER